MTFNIIHLDDHKIFRQGLKNILLNNINSSFEIQEFEQNSHALHYISNCFKLRKKIDLIITDFNHPGPDGLQFIKTIRENYPACFKSIPIMMLTMRDDWLSFREAFTNGHFQYYALKSY